MKLSHYVVRTFSGEQDILFHTVTRKVLLADADEKTLAENFFYAGQEKQAVLAKLAQPPDGWFHFHLSPTWECNLRCTHCMVRHRLIKDDTNILEVAPVIRLAQQSKQLFDVRRMSVNFFGGESMLAIDKCNEIVDAFNGIDLELMHFQLFTNLTMELTDKHLEFFRQVDSIGVSIDGLEQIHNAQRMPISPMNPFEKTMQNLKILVKQGWKEKISIQACLSDQHNTLDNRVSFYRTILQFGIRPHRIMIGTIAPTKTNPTPGDHYKKGLHQVKLTDGFCCKYRLNNLVIDNTGNVFSDYYSYTKIGTVNDDLLMLLGEKEKITLETAPALNDPKCQKCPALGFCWGGCSVTENDAPLSTYCNQDGIIAVIEEAAKLGQFKLGNENGLPIDSQTHLFH